MVENKHFTLENIKFFCLDQNFDNVTCCIPSFDFRAPSAQACIVSALSTGERILGPRQIMTMPFDPHQFYCMGVDYRTISISIERNDERMIKCNGMK